MKAAPGMLTTAAAFRGEFEKMLLALAIVLAIMLVVWAIEQWRASGWRWANPAGWLVTIAAGVVGLIIASLFTLGLI